MLICAVYAYRIDRDGQGQGGIDAAGQPEHGARKSVLRNVITHAEHERVVDTFGIVREHVVRAREREAAGVPRNLDERGGFTKLAHVYDRLTARIDDERTAVEHEFVLAANEIHVGDRQARSRDRRLQRGQPRRAFVHAVRRGVDVQDHFRPGVARRDRRCRLPDVLADVDRQAYTAGLDDADVLAWREIALFIEHGVVRQLLLAIACDAMAIAQDRATVVHAPAVRFGVPDDGRYPVGFGRDGVECPAHAFVQRRAEQQVFRGVAGDREFGERDHVGPVVRACRRQRGDDHRGVAVDVADAEIKLRKREAEHGRH